MSLVWAVGSGPAGRGRRCRRVIAGAATVSLVGRRRLTPGFAFGVALWGIPLVAIAVVSAAVPVIVFLAIAGVGYAFMDVSGRTLLQRAVDETALGRVFACSRPGSWPRGRSVRRSLPSRSAR
jgi:hypothetical protein